jgi:hypothetical protein
LRDADSFWGRSISHFTTTSSKLSMVFDFDRELFSTRVYDVAFRGSVKALLRKRQTPEQIRSSEIDQQLSSGRKKPSQNYSVLILGRDLETRQILTGNWILLFGKVDEFDQDEHRKIKQAILFKVKSVIQMATAVQSELDARSRSHANALLQEIGDDGRDLDSTLAESVYLLWTSNRFRMLCNKQETNHLDL